jgi:iron complex outermembrane receptor protein
MVSLIGDGIKNTAIMNSFLRRMTVGTAIMLIALTNIDIMAQPSDSTLTYRLDPLVITGTRITRQKSEIPASISVISRQTIENNTHVNVLPILADRVPGLFVSDRNMVGYGVGPESGGNISIRGVSGNPNTRVLMLIDGQPQFMGIFGHPISDAYTGSDIERIEVIRGPGSILYGSNAMGGAVNIITRKPAEGLLLYGKAAYGSYNTSLLTGSVGYNKNKFSVIGSVNNERTDGIRDDANDAFKNTTGYLKLDYQVSKSINVSFDGNIIDAGYNFPGTVEQPQDTARRDYLRSRTALALENRYENVEGALMFFYNYGDHSFTDGFRSNDHNYGLTFYQNLKFFKGNVITLGYDLKKFGGKASNIYTPELIPKGFDIDHDITENDIYAFVQQSLNNLTFDVGYRYVRNSSYGNQHVPAGGITYKLSQNTFLKASVTKGFRSPAIVDMFLFPTSTDSLQPERLWNYEFSWGQSFLEGKLDFEITGFIIDGENMIQEVLISVPPPVKQNTGAFTNRGIEFASNYNLNRNLMFNLNYTYLNTSEEFKYAPEHEINFHGMYQLNPVSFMIGLKYVNDLNTFISENEVSKENYTLLNLKINWKLLEWMNVFIEGKNLLNSTYEIDKGYPLPGINFIGGLEFRYHN